MTIKSPFDGRPFKVLGSIDGTVMAEFDRLDEAQAYADKQHRLTDAHYRVIEVKWCGGSMRLSGPPASSAR